MADSKQDLRSTDTSHLSGDELCSWMRFVEACPDAHDVAEALAVRGRELRKSRPRQEPGIVQYVWRMAQFHSGRDTNMPMTCDWWLSQWLEEEGIQAQVNGIVDQVGTLITDHLDDVATEVCVLLGEEPTRAARRWSKAGLL